MALPTIITELERSIYEAIRVVTVAEGFTPDVTTYTNVQTDYDQYKADLHSIFVSKGFAIEVFNNSAPEQKGMIKTSRISIVHGGTAMGDIGLPVQKDFADYGQTQGLVVGTTMTNEYAYEVYITARNLMEFRICQGIVLQALPARSWIGILNDPDPKTRFLNNMVSGYASPGDLRGVKEFVYAYTVPDLLTSLYSETEVIPNMIEYSLELSTYLGI